MLKKILFVLSFFSMCSIWPATDLSLANSSNPKIVMNGLNGVAVWQESDAIKSAYTSDGGDVWSESQNISTIGANSSPSICMEGTNVVVVWVGNTAGGDYEIYGRRSSDSGVTWDGFPVEIANSAASVTYSIPQVAVRGDNLVAVWQDSTGSILSSNATFSGFSWSIPILLSDATGGVPPASNPQIAMNGSYVVVVFQDTIPRILNNVSVDMGASWQFDPSAPNVVAIGAVGNPQVDNVEEITVAVWENAGVIETSFSNGAGEIWEIPSTLTSGNTADPKVVMDGPNAVIVWGTAIGGTELVQGSTSSDGGLTWSSAIPISSSPGSNPDLAINGTNVAVVWLSDDNRIATALSTNSGVSWSNPELISEDLSIQPPRVVIGDNPIGIWQTTTGKIQVSKIVFESELISVSVRKQAYNKALFQIDIVNEIKWNALSEAVLYRVYSDISLSNRIAEVVNPVFYDHGVKEGSLKKYYITWVDGMGIESSATEVSVP